MKDGALWAFYGLAQDGRVWFGVPQFGDVHQDGGPDAITWRILEGRGKFPPA